ncbi:MAG: serine--tRNA ligase, partial [Maioricimonas sp. JB049]
MLDLQFIIENRQAVEENCRDRKITVDLDRLGEQSDQPPQLKSTSDEQRRTHKHFSAHIPRAPPPEKPNQIPRG